MMGEGMTGPRKRIEWIDCAKGLGILLVVVGHANEGRVSDVIYLFHMPLFFMIAGLTFRPVGLKDFLVRRSVSLLLPYLSFLVVMLVAADTSHVVHGMAPNIERSIIDAAYGGRRLQGDFGTFWFITCLFGALFFYNLVRSLVSDPLRPWFVAAMIGLAVVAFPLGRHVLPENASVMPMAMVFIWTGEVWRDRTGLQPVEAGRFLRPEERLPMVAALLIATLGILMRRPMDMKYGDFGLPLLSVVIAVAMSHIVLLFGRWAAETGWMGRVFGMLGAASLCIMFLHRTITVHLVGHMSWVSVSLIATVVPFGAYMLLKHSDAPLRALFLGERGPALALLARFQAGWVSRAMDPNR